MRERPYLQQAIAELRDTGDWDDVPDDAMARLFVIQQRERGLAIQNLMRVFADTLASPFRR